MSTTRPIACLLQVVFFAFVLAAALPATAQLILPSTLSMSPSSATGGGTIRVSATQLPDGHYRVQIIAGRESYSLVDMPDGRGSIGTNVTLPALPAGNYTVELRVDGSLTHSRSYKILPPLTVTPATTTPRAGSTLSFSVSGLAKGNLSLVYAGKVAFGPVSVEAGTYSGKLVLPVDRPASLPASVALQARNAVGKTVPRVGSTTLSVQTPDRSPLVRIGASNTSSTSIDPRQTLSASGQVTTNEFNPAAASVQYWWRDSLGRVAPMGAQQTLIGVDGGFSATMRAPQMGTQSALGAAGQGEVFAVGQARDRHGTRQQQPQAVGSGLQVALDTDDAIDITLYLRGSDGLAVEGARVVLATSQLDDLYPPNDNRSPIRLDQGIGAALMPSQFQTVTDEILDCPDDLERQTSSAVGKVEFEFGLSLPAQGFNVDGSGPAPVLTIEPSLDCVSIPTNSTGPNTDASRCTLVDPAGIHAQLTVIAAHTGYGWLSASSYLNNGLPREIPIKVDLRIDRNTGRISTKFCEPDLDPTDAYVPPCTEQDFERSATLNLVLPKLPGSGLLLTDPTWRGTYTGDIRFKERFGGLVVYQKLPDLSDFEGKATFDPVQPAARTFAIGYVRGAGNPLASATLHFSGRSQPIELRSTAGAASCDVAATEVWSAELPPDVLQGLRFPRSRFGLHGNQLYGWVVAREADSSRTGLRAFRFDFSRPGSNIRALAALPGLKIDTYHPHAARVTLPSSDATGSTQTGDANRNGCDDDECNDYPELRNKTSQAEANLDMELCLPVGSHCGSYSAVNSTHEQHGQKPPTQPPGVSFTGAGGSSDSDAPPWKVLFDKTIPLFRWYWGVPEVFSARVFADLGLTAKYLFNYVIKPLDPLKSYVETGGSLSVLINIGVDVSVLFGILVDAGAQISGVINGEVIAKASANAPTAPCTEENLRFAMSFSYWVEIGCPIDFPLDPTCWIPDIEGTHPIFNETIAEGDSCLAGKRRTMAPWERFGAQLAGLDPSYPSLPPAADKMAISPRHRRNMNRHPAISIDGAGNRLALYIDSRSTLVATDTPVDGTPSTHRLSSGWGLRDVAVMHYGVGRAVAVWAESDLQAAPDARTDLASRQYLRYAVFDGTQWSAAANLTAPGFGEGGVRLARCVPRLLFQRTDCSLDKVSLVFQRNTGRRTGGPSQIFLSRFDGVAWSLPQRVDQSGQYNITPAIAYQNGKPVVAWVRYAPEAIDLSDVDRRNLALRVMDGSSPEELHTRITRVAQPDLAGTSDRRLAVAYTRAAATDAFVGTRQALHLGERSCGPDTCSIRSFAVLDEHGRRLFGERPRLVANADGGVNVAFRTLSFGSLPGALDATDNRMPGDPIGIATTRGELLNVVSNLSTNQTRVMLQSNDGGGHLQAAAAFDPATGEVVTLSGLLPDAGGVFRGKGAGEGRLLARSALVDEGLQMGSLPVLADLAMETLASQATMLTPGANITVQVGVVNAGGGWEPDSGRSATLRLYWDTPATRETLHGNLAIPALAPGQRFETELSIPVPAVFGSDERQTLRAELLIDDPDGELDGANNAASLPIGGMPVPQNLRALSAPGSRIVNLAWDDPADARVAGYRVWVDDANGQPRPMGSSFNLGFADLSALFGFKRSYRVSTYSVRGIESELSEALTAEPAPAIALGDADTLLKDSFE
jgi:hypothetical protein